MRDRRVHVQIRQRRLLARHDHVDVVAAAQAVIGHRQQRVGVRRQVHPHHLGPLVGDVVDETGILMRGAVVVLTPNMGRQKVIQRCDRPPPRQLAAAAQPLGVLVEHRVDDVHERLVAVEQPVPAGEQVSLEPALAQMLGEHLHHAAVGPRFSSSGPVSASHALSVDSNTAAEPVRRGFVGPHQAEPVGVAGDHVAKERAEHAGGFGGSGRRFVHGDGVIGEVGQVEVAQQQPAVGVRVGAHPALPGRRQRPQLRPKRPLRVEQLLGPVAAQPLLELRHVLRVGVRLRQRHLMRPPGALDLLAVHLLRARSSPSGCA